MSTLFVEDYGAKGDGIKNDRDAISKAIDALKEAPEGSSLVFGKEKTYYCGSEDAGIWMVGIKDRSVKGDNTTITVDAPSKFFEVVHCEDFILQGFNYTYRKKPFAFSVSVEEIDPENLAAVMTLDRSLEISDTYVAPTVEFFSLVARPDGRYHMSISTIDVVDEKAFKYKFTFNKTFVEIEKRIGMLPEFGMIVPMPHVGHLVELACTSLCNKNVTFKDSNLYSSCKFMFFLRGNEETVVFDNFNVLPDTQDNPNNTLIASWRDGFHCKENRAKLIWKNCNLSGMFDDVFNISCSMLRVLKTEGEGKNQKISFRWPETNGPYGFICVGDEISFYHREAGRFYGKGKVVWVEGDTVMLDREIKGLQPEFQACVNTLAAPYSEVINCNIQGTIRFRTPVIVKDCNIHCNRMWLAFERDGFEGPLAENQLFENCNFTFDSDSEPFIEIYSGNPMKEEVVSGKLSENDIYRIKNIVFKNCRLDENAVTVGDVDALFEDSVRFIGCTK